MHHPTDWIVHTTAFVTPVVEHWLSDRSAEDIKKTMIKSGTALPYLFFRSYVLLGLFFVVVVVVLFLLFVVLLLFFNGKETLVVILITR